jgi:hypothetical protein
MATSTTDVVKNNAADYMNAVLAKAQAGRLKPHEANVAAAVMAGYYDWTEAISKRELVERAGAIVDAAQALREQGQLQLASAEVLNAKLAAPASAEDALREAAGEELARRRLFQASKTSGRRKTSASK